MVKPKFAPGAIVSMEDFIVIKILEIIDFYPDLDFPIEYKYTTLVDKEYPGRVGNTYWDVVEVIDDSFVMTAYDYNDLWEELNV